MEQGLHSQLHEISRLVFQYISTTYPSIDKRDELSHISVPCSSLEVYEAFRLPLKESLLPAVKHTINIQSQRNPIANSLRERASPSSIPIEKPYENAQKHEEKPSLPLQHTTEKKKQHDISEEIEVILPPWKETDEAIYEKKKRIALFPRPYLPPIQEDYYSASSLRAIQTSTGKNFHTTIQYPVSRCKSLIPNAWKIVTLLHPTSSPKELHLFAQSIKQALETKLSIQVGNALSLQEIRNDLFKELSLSDASIALFLGESHQLSSLQSFLDEITYFHSETKIGFTPCQYLGKYFDTIFLFLPIDIEFIHNQLLKQELWRLLKRLV